MRTAIYKIANTNNNKLYIGISNNPEARWREHLYDAKRKRNKLYNAMRKYGAGTFKMEVLHWCGSRDAAKACGVSESLVSMHCKNKVRGGKSKKGFTFRQQVQ